MEQNTDSGLTLHKPPKSIPKTVSSCWEYRNPQQASALVDLLRTYLIGTDRGLSTEQWVDGYQIGAHAFLNETWNLPYEDIIMSMSIEANTKRKEVGVAADKEEEEGERDILPTARLTTDSALNDRYHPANILYTSSSTTDKTDSARLEYETSSDVKAKCQEIQKKLGMKQQEISKPFQTNESSPESSADEEPLPTRTHQKEQSPAPFSCSILTNSEDIV